MAPYMLGKQRQPAPQPPQPQGESFTDFDCRQRGVSLTATATDTYTAAEKEQARQYRFAMDCGQIGVGQVLPARLLQLIYEGRPMPAALQAGQVTAAANATRSRLAASIDASFDIVKPHAGRDLGTDSAEYPRGTGRLSFKGQQIYDKLTGFGHMPPFDEPIVTAAFDEIGILSTTERIALRVELTEFGLVSRPSGPLTLQEFRPRRPIPGIAAKRSGRTMQASVGTRGAYSCAYDGTSISVADPAE